MKRLVCIVEGKGEVRAVPTLCARILKEIGASSWTVDSDPIRRPRGTLVDEGIPTHKRPCHARELGRALEMALARDPDGLIVLCDADRDCPAVWGPSAIGTIRARTAVPATAVMCVLEYEAWLLRTYSDEEHRAAKVRDPERTRGAKEELRKLVPDYMPTTHQLELTRRIDVTALRTRSRSFDKLVRGIETITAATRE